MSYVQGTKVRLSCAATNEETGEPLLAPQLTCWVRRPDNVTVDYTAQIVDDGGGHFHVVVDTTPAFGVYAYQWEETSPQGTTERSSFTVRQSVTPPLAG